MFTTISRPFVNKTDVLLTGYFINTFFLDISLSDFFGSDGDQVVSSQQKSRPVYMRLKRFRNKQSKGNLDAHLY